MISQRRPYEPTTYDDEVVYRAELIRIDRDGRRTSYRDCGDFSPYCVEELLDNLRSESHTSFRTLVLKLDLRGKVNQFQIDDLARRFVALRLPGVQVQVSAPGHSPLVLGPAMPARGRADSASVPSH